MVGVKLKKNYLTEHIEEESEMVKKKPKNYTNENIYAQNNF